MSLCITSEYLGLNYNQPKQHIMQLSTHQSCIAGHTFFGILMYHCMLQPSQTMTIRKVRNVMKEIHYHSCLKAQALPPVIRFDHLHELLVEAQTNTVCKVVDSRSSSNKQCMLQQTGKKPHNYCNNYDSLCVD